jgi:rod shape determining protein RodA
MFLLSGLNVALRAKDRYGCLIAFGFTAYFFWHIFINICMELGMLPVVGIPLPFLSYGGSMTLTCFVGVGVILGVNVRRFIF